MPAFTHQAPPDAPYPLSERVQRYQARLDTLLDEMPLRDRLRELREERQRWIARSELFAADVDAGRPIPVGAKLSDYDDVIDLLGKRIAAEERRCAVIPTEANHAG